VELRLSTSMRVLAVVSPLVLLGLGLYGVVRGGVRTPGAVLVVVAVLVGGAAAWVLPWVTTMDADGVHRRSLLRRHDVPWDEVVAIERHRRRANGPLVLRTVGRDRIALADAVERPAQWDSMREVVRLHAPGAAVPDPPTTHPFHRR
jgi:hypothetical protein